MVSVTHGSVRTGTNGVSIRGISCTFYACFIGLIRALQIDIHAEICLSFEISNLSVTLIIDSRKKLYVLWNCKKNGFSVTKLKLILSL